MPLRLTEKQYAQLLANRARHTKAARKTATATTAIGQIIVGIVLLIIALFMFSFLLTPTHAKTKNYMDYPIDQPKLEACIKETNWKAAFRDPFNSDPAFQKQTCEQWQRTEQFSRDYQADLKARSE